MKKPLKNNKIIKKKLLPSTLEFNFLDKEKYSRETIFMHELLTCSFCQNKPLTITELNNLKQLSLKLSLYNKEDIIKDLIENFTNTLQELSRFLLLEPQFLFDKLFTLFTEKPITKETPIDSTIIKLTNITQLINLSSEKQLICLLNYIIININTKDNYGY